MRVRFQSFSFIASYCICCYYSNSLFAILSSSPLPSIKYVPWSVHRCLRNRSSRLFDQHPKTLRILLVYKIRDTRFQLLLINWACTLLAVLGAGICGFDLMPMFLAVGAVAEGVFLFVLVLCIGAGDILLDFALEDERFFELATRCHALISFEDTKSL
jgi:hypothetical protein